MVDLKRSIALFFSLCLIKAIVAAPSHEGKEIADKFGDDLSFASKQLIRGITAIVAPAIDKLQKPFLPKFNPISGRCSDSRIKQSIRNFKRVLFRDGMNAIGKGVKAGATILSAPARLFGAGLEEARKVREGTGISSRIQEANAVGFQRSSAQTTLGDLTKITSALLNTTASQFSQANLGAVLTEVALKNRIKDFINKKGITVQTTADPCDSSSNNEDETTTPSRVDVLIERFNEAVRRNDERVTNALKNILTRINPSKS